jgi:hypothetical protein
MAVSSLLENRVPLGFVCGYPVDTGELYGGSMFVKSAATDTAQGKAMCQANTRWGSLDPKSHDVAIGHAVCKNKYKPFLFQQHTDSTGRVSVHVERLYGCACHHEARKAVIQQHGLRPGWQPFGVFSLGKAVAAARKQAARLNRELQQGESDEGETDGEASLWSDESTLCGGGRCTWARESAYDDIEEELEIELGGGTRAEDNKEA